MKTVELIMRLITMRWSPCHVRGRQPVDMCVMQCAYAKQHVDSTSSDE